jgi:hypothetical protein
VEGEGRGTGGRVEGEEWRAGERGKGKSELEGEWRKEGRVEGEGRERVDWT